MGAENENLSDYEEGARRALEWLGRSEDAAELAQIIGEMPPKLGDMEAAFLIAIGRAALAGHKAAPQTEDDAKARPAMLPPPAEAPQCNGSTSTSSTAGGGSTSAPRGSRSLRGETQRCFETRLGLEGSGPV
jgi:hypothetical protein